MGVSRSGKSLLLNLLTRYLIENDYASVSAHPLFSKELNKNNSIEFFPFGVSEHMSRCTVGINGVFLKRKVKLTDDNTNPSLYENVNTAGYYLLLDAEGSDNGNRRVVSRILGIGRHLTNVLVFVDDNRFERALDALGRLIAYGMASYQAHGNSPSVVTDTNILNQEPQTITITSSSDVPPSAISEWPHLIMCLNKVLEKLPPNDMAFYASHIQYKVEDDEATNQLRQLMLTNFPDLDFVTLPHSEIVRDLIEEGVSSHKELITKIDLKTNKNVFNMKLNSLIHLVLNRVEPLMMQNTIMNGAMFAIHLQQLLVKSKTAIFPDSNYLSQIVQELCENVHNDHLQMYTKQIETMKLGGIPVVSHLISRKYTNSKEIIETHEPIQNEILNSFKMKSKEYNGCLVEYYKLQQLMNHSLQAMVNVVMNPIGSKTEQKYVVLNEWVEENLDSIQKVNEVQTSSGISKQNVELFSIFNLMITNPLFLISITPYEIIKMNIEVYQKLSVAHRNISILGNGVEIMGKWDDDQIIHKMLYTKSKYIYKQLTIEYICFQTFIFYCILYIIGNVFNIMNHVLGFCDQVVFIIFNTKNGKIAERGTKADKTIVADSGTDKDSSIQIDKPRHLWTVISKYVNQLRYLNVILSYCLSTAGKAIMSLMYYGVQHYVIREYIKFNAYNAAINSVVSTAHVSNTFTVIKVLVQCVTNCVEYQWNLHSTIQFASIFLPVILLVLLGTVCMFGMLASVCLMKLGYFVDVVQASDLNRVAIVETQLSPPSSQNDLKSNPTTRFQREEDSRVAPSQALPDTNMRIPTRRDNTSSITPSPSLSLQRQTMINRVHASEKMPSNDVVCGAASYNWSNRGKECTEDLNVAKAQGDITTTNIIKSSVTGDNAKAHESSHANIENHMVEKTQRKAIITNPYSDANSKKTTNIMRDVKINTTTPSEKTHSPQELRDSQQFMKKLLRESKSKSSGRENRPLAVLSSARSTTANTPNSINAQIACNYDKNEKQSTSALLKKLLGEL